MEKGLKRYCVRRRGGPLITIAVESLTVIGIKPGERLRRSVKLTSWRRCCL